MINRILPLASTAFLIRSPRVSGNNALFFASTNIVVPVIPKRSFWKGILHYWPTMVMGMISGALGIGAYQYVDFAHHHPEGVDSAGHEHNHKGGHDTGGCTDPTHDHSPKDKAASNEPPKSWNNHASKPHDINCKDPACRADELKDRLKP